MSKQVRYIVVVIVALVFSAAVMGCTAPLVGKEELKEGDAAGVILDVSGSTEEARPAYVEEFGAHARELALRRANLFVILAAGDPQSEGRVMKTRFLADQEGTAYADAEATRDADTVTGQVNEMLRNPPTEVGGTALIRATLKAEQELAKYQGKKELTLYSDGVEASQDLDLHNIELTDEGIVQALDELEAKHLLSDDLRGVPVRFVLPGYHPGGSKLDPVGVERFWRAWAERVGAELTYG